MRSRCRASASLDCPAVTGLRLTGLLLALALAGVLASGCGGGGGSERLSKEEFQTRADAICKRYEGKLAALGKPLSPADIPQFVEKSVPVIQQGLVELRALRPPADVQDDWNRMLDETAKAIPAARQLAAAAAKKDASGVQAAFAAGTAASKAADRIATKLGLVQCAATS